MKTITSRDNPIYKQALKLTRRKGREETGLYLLEGVKPLADALDQGVRVERIFLEEGAGIIGAEETKLTGLERSLFRKLTDTETSQGVVAVIRQQESGPERLRELLSRTQSPAAPEGAGAPRLLVLDRIQDPGNLGTMIRTAEAAGMAGVILIRGCADPYAPKTCRAAAGSLLRIPVLTGIREAGFLREAEAAGWKVCVTALEDAADYREADYSGRLALVIGNEGRGVSPGFLAAADQRIRIPMQGGIESLNAAVAAGILMYESVHYCRCEV